MIERTLRAGLITVVCTAFSACASTGYKPVDFGTTEKTAEETAPLGGASLDHRRENMGRMYSDLMQFRTALDDAEQRGDRTTTVALSHFVDAYIGMHLDPQATYDEFARFSSRDADRYLAMLADWDRAKVAFSTANNTPIGWGPSPGALARRCRSAARQSTGAEAHARAKPRQGRPRRDRHALRRPRGHAGSLPARQPEPARQGRAVDSRRRVTKDLP